MSRKNLVDGSTAYKERKFDRAEEMFRIASDRDPEGDTLEGRTAKIFLARTLHSRFIGNRDDRAKAEEAITAYEQSLPSSLKEYTEAKAEYDQSPGEADSQRRLASALSLVNSTASAISSLYENLQLPDKAREWRLQIAGSENYPPTARATALNALAAKSNSCANDVTDTEQTKKTVKQDNKDVFQFVKPENPDDLAKLQACLQEGTNYVNQAIALEPDAVKNIGSVDIKSAPDEQLRLYSEWVKPFESARSYKASMTIQAMRLAEMEGRTEDRDRLRAEADQLRSRFTSLSETSRAIQTELEARRAAEEAAANANANTANASK